MTDAWEQCEGQVVNGEFHLRRYLGGGKNSAVFLTEHGEQEPHKAAIKLLVAPPEEPELQLSHWELASKLSHPHLIRLFQMGRCQLGDMILLYVVMEYAEETLSQVVPRRPLTPAETREVLEPALDALAYLHGQGFVHGHIKPANIMSVEDQLKLSSDGLYRIGESTVGLGKPGAYDAPEMASETVTQAADVWSLGVTVVEALTQHLPVWRDPERGEPALSETLPAEFRELAHHCLQRARQQRWTIADLATHIRQTPPAHQGETASSRQPAFAKWGYIAPLVALGAVLTATVVPRLFNHFREAPTAPSAAVGQPDVQPEPVPNPVMPGAGKSEARPLARMVGPVPGKVLHQVLPDVPRRARETIRGTVRVAVRVRVDPSGNVAGAKLVSPGPSKYFAQLALKAARRWKFRPAEVDARNVPSEWILRFQFAKAGTTALSVQAPP